MLGPVLDALFPPRCAGCGRGTWPFCDACLERLSPLGPPWCRRCGAPRALDASGCQDCPPASIARARAPFLFDGPARQAVHRLKFAGWRGVAGALGAAMAAVHEGSIPDTVTWVPLSRRRRATRGFDQARALAEVVGRELALPVSRLLVREGDLGPQARRGGVDRRQAMRGAFAPSGVAPDRVLLVDDVLTTGATAGACAEALRSSGAREVSLLTAARAVSGVSFGARRADILGSGFAHGSVVARGTAPRKSRPAAGEATHVSRPLVGEHGAV